MLAGGAGEMTFDDGRVLREIGVVFVDESVVVRAGVAVERRHHQIFLDDARVHGGTLVDIDAARRRQRRRGEPRGQSDDKRRFAEGAYRAIDRRSPRRTGSKFHVSPQFLQRYQQSRRLQPTAYDVSGRPKPLLNEPVNGTSRLPGHVRGIS